MSEKKKLYVSIIASMVCTILGCVLTYYFTICSIDYENALEIYQENKTNEELLLEAEMYYKMGELDKTFQIYSLDNLSTEPIALNNLAYLYENGIFVSRDVSRAKELYDKAYKLGNVEVVNNWIIFNLKYPESLYNLVDNLAIAHNMGSYVPSDFISQYVDNEVAADELIDSLRVLNETQLLYVLSKRMYEEQVNDGLMELIGNEFIVDRVVETDDIECLIGTYEEKIDLGDDIGTFQICCRSIPLYGTRPKSELWYKRKYFIYTWQNSTEFIYIK